MKIKLLSFILSFFMASMFAMVYGQVITGTVTDQNGLPLPGVNVLVKGTNTGTQTDFDGNYTIEASSSNTLIFSYLGQKTVERTVGSNTNINIQMEEDASQLEEVVVVGYGSQKKSDLTGSVASVSGDEIARLPVASVDNALKGRAAGAFISSPSGTPGAGISIQIRGNTSLSASSEPLYVIDGIPMISEDLSDLFSGGQRTNSMADINPTDIASIEILKDASATAIYGSRGANGVVLITTKRGSTGAPRVEFNSYYGFQTVTNTIDMLSSQEYLELMNDAAAQDNIDLGTDYPENYVSDLWGFDPNDPELRNTKWYDEIFRTAAIQSHDVSVSGGNERTQYYTSLAYFNQEGTQLGTGFERISGRINLDTQVKDWLKIGTNVAVTRTIQDRTINDNSLYGVVINTLAGDPLMPVREDDGTYASPFDYFGWWMLDNPVLVANEYSRFTRTTRGLGTIFAELQLTKSLKFRTSTSIDYTSLTDESFTPTISFESIDQNANGLGRYSSTEDFTWITENYFTYTPDLGDNHSLNAILGASYQASDRNFTRIDAQGFPSDQFTKLETAAQVTDAYSRGTEWGLASYYFRANYGLANKYLLTLTGRADGSSRFGDQNRFGFFPSGSVAWRVSQEDFLKNSKTISDLKFRASYGITGNQDGITNSAGDILNFPARGLFGIDDYRQRATLIPTQLSNQNLSWESTAQFNVGVDLGLFNNRLSLTADYFIKKTDDLLLDRIIPGISGFSSVIDNIGEVENRGFELTVNGAIFTGDFKWDSSFNISFIDNEIKKLAVDRQIISDSHILAEGNPIGTFFLIDHNGVDPQTGNMLWIDLNEDGNINADDRQIVGNAQPDFFGGWNNTFSYKGFDFSFLFQFNIGNEIFNNSRAIYENLGWSRIGTGFPLPDGNNYAGARNRWRQPGDITDIPRASLESGNWQQYSTRWLEDGSFVRLKNLNIGYRLPQEVVSKLGLQKFRVFVQGQNLLTFTDYTGLDPEVSRSARDPRLAGSDFGTLPQARTITLGFNIGL
ncbi:TonB-dependent receptor SusC [Flagellimonas maritima]|uniref:TonB-dependent receptor SusC n=1 Tax=Flagellimonas maritima TaxID=1383885 RepID=A0A2Z4LUH6_9FLAO|nr:TonB-dependent receptor [Allomuricauda aurantiaca]AWX45551.1 TonB-dependent receptor SusC [Allomuricauda aurantiaca]